MEPAPTPVNDNAQRLAARAESPPLVICCEHAANRVPEDVELGVDAGLLESHWGWDRWAWEVARGVAGRLGAEALGSRISRLVADMNRDVHEASVVPERVGEVEIPGNQLDDAGRQARLGRFHVPYHQALDTSLAAARQRFGAGMLLFSVHSFTPHYGTEERTYPAGLLFDGHEDLAREAQRLLERAGLEARLNQPYSGYEGLVYSVSRHGRTHDVPYLELELNQGWLEDGAERQRLTGVVRALLQGLLDWLEKRG